MDKSKIIQMLVVLAAITVIAGSLSRMVQGNSMSLTEYEALQTADSPESGSENTDNSSQDTNRENTDDGSSSSSVKENLQTPSPSPSAAESEDKTSVLTGATLNGESQLDARVTYADSFYYEPVSDELGRYMTGVSYPSKDSEAASSGLAVTFDDLRYLHIMHYDFDGNPAEGELICNNYIAQDLVEIFYQLYLNEYQLESVLLIDEFDGDDTASMEANNTSCFNYRVVEGSTSLSKHAYGLAVDINPLYNPYVTYEKDGTESISPAAADSYADRSASFAYKIDENDLCYKLFTQHGFIWGGNWNNVKDYQHFQKVKP